MVFSCILWRRNRCGGLLLPATVLSSSLRRQQAAVHTLLPDVLHDDDGCRRHRAFLVRRDEVVGQPATVETDMKEPIPYCDN
jgi:hypothetical protein